MRLIDADALKDGLFIKFGNRLPNGLIGEINNAPTVEKRPPGKWIYVCCYGDEFPQCSICGEINDVKTNFCPDCGADMRGEEI